MGNIDNLHGNDLEMSQEADWADGLAERAKTIAARRQHIADLARCQRCRTDRATCIAGMKGNGPEGICCWGGIGHRHIEDSRLVDELIKEITAGGDVRAVAEVDPPPVLGPAVASAQWLLGQDVWWYPNRRPAVRIAAMDKPWRFNTARFIERRADALADEEHWRMARIAAGPLGPSGDMAQDGFRREMDSILDDPLGWLRSTPLMQALRHGLPREGTKESRMLAARAAHWNTCPMRKAHPGKLDRCQCIREDGATVGATNDPGSRASVDRATRNALMTPEWTS